MHSVKKDVGIALIVLGILIVVIFIITPKNSSSLPETTNLKSIIISENEVEAIYLCCENGVLSPIDLANHPEVLVVDSFDEFLDAVPITGAALWVDKGAIESIDLDWLHQKPQKYYPLVIVGYNDPVYAFREKLSGFGIEDPSNNWSEITPAPGFSVWRLKEDGETSTSAFIYGYPCEPNVESILKVSSSLLHGEPWRANP